jgi:hypothetical protein
VVVAAEQRRLAAAQAALQLLVSAALVQLFILLGYKPLALGKTSLAFTTLRAVGLVELGLHRLSSPLAV